MTVRHRRPHSLAVLALTLCAFTASALLPLAAEAARRKAKARGKKPGKSAAAAVRPLNVGPMKFKVSNPNITQHLEVIPQAPGSVAFTLMIDGGCRRAISGLASAGTGQAPPGQDEFAVSYPVNEYLYQGKDGCFLSLRIDAKAGKRATIGQIDCEAACAPIEDLMFRTTKPPGHGH